MTCCLLSDDLLSVNIVFHRLELTFRVPPFVVFFIGLTVIGNDRVFMISQILAAS